MASTLSTTRLCWVFLLIEVSILIYIISIVREACSKHGPGISNTKRVKRNRKINNVIDVHFLKSQISILLPSTAFNLINPARALQRAEPWLVCTALRVCSLWPASAPSDMSGWPVMFLPMQMLRRPPARTEGCSP